MSPATVYAVQRLQTKPRTPSSRTLTVSKDNQVLLVGDQELYIFTPDPDFAYEPKRPSLLRVQTTSIHTALKRGFASRSMDDGDEDDEGRDEADGGGGGGGGGGGAAGEENKPAREEEEPSRVNLKIGRVGLPDGQIAWERTQSQDFRTMNTGTSIYLSPTSWLAATWSPSGLSALGGCLVVAVTGMGEAFIFEAEKDAIVGQWTNRDNVTRKLLRDTEFPAKELSVDEPLQGQLEYEARRVFDAQTTCLDWSAQPTRRTERVGQGDLSLLALGSKGGTITFWRWNPSQGAVCVGKIRVEERWISNVAWSDWEEAADGHLQAVLAYSTPLGDVKLVDVRLSSPSEVKVSEARVLAASDDRPVTLLNWLWGGLLAYAKVGEVFLERVPIVSGGKGKRRAQVQDSESEVVGGSEWSGKAKWRLKRFGSWAGSSRLATCCGVSWHSPTSIAFSLADGSHHIVTLSSSSDTLSDATYDLAQSKYLTTQSRELFETIEKPMVQAPHYLDQAATRTAGCVRFGSSWMWLQETAWDYNMTYFPSSKTHATLVLVDIPLESGVARAQAIDRILNLLTNRQSNYLLESPQVEFFPAFLPFYVLEDQPTPLPSISQQLLDALRPLPPAHAPSTSTGMSKPTDSADVKRWMRDGLRGDLWGPASGRVEGSSLLKRLGVAENFAERVGPRKSEFAALRDSLSKRVLTEVLVLILGWVEQVMETITHAEDKRLLTLFTHIVLSALLQPSASRQLGFSKDILRDLTGRIFDLGVALDVDIHVDLDVLASVMKLEEQMSDPEEEDDDDELPALAGEENGKEKKWDIVNLGETCPACGEGINFEDVESACCSRGHEWDRCSITFQVISKAQCRRCVQCARPAVLPPSSRFSGPSSTVRLKPLPGLYEVGYAVKPERTEEDNMVLDVPLPRDPNGPAMNATASHGSQPPSPSSTVHDVDMRDEADSDDDVQVTLDNRTGAPAAGLAMQDDDTEDDGVFVSVEVKQETSDAELAGPRLTTDGHASPWLMDELLEAAGCCLYCGGRFALTL